MYNNFYVYIYLDPRKPGNYKYGEYNFDYEPFYVGKGKNNRYLKHLHYNDSSIKTLNIKTILNENLKPIIIKYKENLIECEAFKLEIDFIKNIRRIDLGTGPLYNRTSGGDGLAGEKNPMYGKHHSEEAKQKIRNFHNGKNLSEETKLKISLSNKGRNQSEEQKRKISEAHKGKIKTKEHCKNISLSKIGCNAWNKGLKMSKKYCENISGKNNGMYGKHHSEEAKKKISINNKGLKRTEETKQKMKKPKSEEHKQKLKESWIKRKEKNIEKYNIG